MLVDGGVRVAADDGDFEVKGWRGGLFFSRVGVVW